MIMSYETLYMNDNGTAKVQMVIDDHVLEQDINIGTMQEEFDNNVLSAMAIFEQELTNNIITEEDFIPELQTTTTVDDLPDIE